MSPCLSICHFKFIIPLLVDTDMEMTPCPHIIAHMDMDMTPCLHICYFKIIIPY